MPLGDMPYYEAVKLARSTAEMPAEERERLVCWLVVRARLSDGLLQQLIALRPELVATAMLEREAQWTEILAHAAETSAEAVRGKLAASAEPELVARGAWTFAWDGAEPVLEVAL